MKRQKKFFEEYWEKLPETKTKFYTRKSEFEKTLRNIDNVKRINVPVKVLVDAVHSAGGLVLVAHPDRHLCRVEKPLDAIRSLIDSGVDGFNLKECKNPLFKEKLVASLDVSEKDKQNLLKLSLGAIFKHICSHIPRKNSLIFDAGGSDCHTREDYLNINHDDFTVTKCRSIMKELTCLHIARMSGKITHRDYGKINLTPVRNFIKENTPIIDIVNEQTGEITLQYNRHTNYGKFADREITREKKDTMVKDVRKAISLGIDFSEGLTIKNVYVSKDWINKILMDNITSTEYKKIVAGEAAVEPKKPSDEIRRSMVSKKASRHFNGGRGGM